jgi:hypothetical protein
MTLRRAALKRTPFGEKARARTNSEAQQMRVLEDLMRPLGLDWWHNTNTGKEHFFRAGWPDYVIFGVNWHAFLELKASNAETGKRGRLSREQIQWQAIIEAGGGEWVTFCLPDDMRQLCAWLSTRTGKQIRSVV